MTRTWKTPGREDARRHQVLARWLLVLSVFWSVHGAAHCPELQVQERVLTSGQGFEYWILEGPAEIVNAPVQDLSQEFPGLSSFRRYIEHHVDPDPFSLLLRQMLIYRKHFGSTFQHNYEAILLGEVGNIREMACLEATLLELHYLRVGNERWDTEMGAWILVQDERIQIHWVSSVSAVVTTPEELVERFERALHRSSSDSALVLHIHNHPFFLSRNPESDIAGTLIPSGSTKSGDLATYRLRQSSWNLQSAWITNGFDTLELTSQDWSNLR